MFLPIQAMYVEIMYKNLHKTIKLFLKYFIHDLGEGISGN
jgi:hypothetical protein